MLMKAFGLQIAYVDLDDPSMVKVTTKLAENVTATKNMA